VIGAASIPLALEAIAKAITYGAVLLAVGASAVRWLMLRRTGAPLHLAEGLHRQLLTTAGTAAGVLVGSLLLRAWTHTAAVFGVAGAFSWSNLQLIALHSRWGSGWRVQIASALCLAIAARWAQAAPRAGWTAIAGVSVMSCYALPLVGHGAGSTWRVLMHGSHVLGGGAWLGTLAVLFILANRSVDVDPTRARRHVFESWLRSFAPIAFAGAALLTSTGVLAAWTYLVPVSSLSATPYGRTLSAKVIIVAAAAVCGLINWRRLHPSSIDPLDRLRDRDARRASIVISLELAFATLIVIVTAFLTELPHP
jgi:putative copper export protein